VKHPAAATIAGVIVRMSTRKTECSAKQFLTNRVVRAAPFALLACLTLCACGRYQDFTLPPQPGGPQITWQWDARPDPVLTRGGAGDWDSVDVLNPSVIRQGDAY